MRRLCFLALCLAASPPTLAGGFLDFGHWEWGSFLLTLAPSASPSGSAPTPAATERDQPQPSSAENSAPLDPAQRTSSSEQPSAPTINPQEAQK